METAFSIGSTIHAIALPEEFSKEDETNRRKIIRPCSGLSALSSLSLHGRGVVRATTGQQRQTIKPEDWELEPSEHEYEARQELEREKRWQLKYERKDRERARQQMLEYDYGY